jgi:sugar phosphate isomerase/epimerase
MHLSTHNWMRAEPLEITLKRIKRLGFESIEISGEPKQYPPSECRPLLKKYGIRCWGAVTLTLGERNLAAKNPKQRAATVDYMKSVVHMVRELEGQEITIVPATGRQGRARLDARGGVGLGRGRVCRRSTSWPRRAACAWRSSRSTASRRTS